MLTDAISLSLLLRQRFHNPKLLEVAVWLSSFQNLSICYLPGYVNVCSDLITRQYNEVLLHNDTRQISKYFAELAVPANKKFWGQKINSQQLKDLLLSSKQSELLDVFSKSSFYRSSERYFSVKNLKELLNRKIPKELEFLAALYFGFSSGSINESQFKSGH